MKKKTRILLLCIAALTALFLFGCAASDASKALCGSWETKSAVSVLGEHESSGTEVDAVLTVTFSEDGKGTWAVLPADGHPAASTGFSYTAVQNKLVLTFENGRTEEYGFSVKKDVLSLQGGSFAGDFTRAD